MGRIVPFHAMDQGICDTLCDIIRAQANGDDFTEGQKKIFDKVMNPDPWEPKDET
jgi:hypothetical protein